LHSILRFYGTAMEDLTAQYLEKSVEHLLRQQEMLRAQMAKMMNAAPMADLLEIARQNVNLWGDLQKRMFGLAPANGPAPSGKKEPEK
jgi:polyhydroxyalkanoate synthesis regulator protein